MPRNGTRGPNWRGEAQPHLIGAKIPKTGEFARPPATKCAATLVRFQMSKSRYSGLRVPKTRGFAYFRRAKCASAPISTPGQIFQSHDLKIREFRSKFALNSENLKFNFKFLKIEGKFPNSSHIPAQNWRKNGFSNIKFNSAGKSATRTLGEPR